MDPAIRDFDGRALWAALDERRRAHGLSWPGAARAIWNMAPVLNAVREARGWPNHPISVTTIHALHRRGDTSCQHALFFLRWLDLSPESFLAGGGAEGAPLPACGPDRRPRFELAALHAALSEAREARGVTWAAIAAAVGCQPGQLSGLGRARYACGMGLAMRAAQWLGRPVADFVRPARW